MSDHYKPHVPDYSLAQSTILRSVFHSALMLGRETVWEGLSYDEAAALNPYTKDQQ